MSEDLIYVFSIMSLVSEDKVPMELLSTFHGQVESLRHIIDVGIPKAKFRVHVEQTGLKLKETSARPLIQEADGKKFWVQEHNLEASGLTVASFESTNSPELYISYLNAIGRSVDRTWF